MKTMQPILALDTASPVVSLAVARQGEVLASATLELRRSSEQLLSTLEETLQEAHVRLAELGGVVALAGPGSFTGVRIGLATVLGIHLSLGLQATALPTLPMLAIAAAESEGLMAGMRLVAGVDSLRGDWTVQPFRVVPSDSKGCTAEPLAEPELLPATSLAALGPGRLVGFGVEELAQHLPQMGLGVGEAPPLAPSVARWVSRHEEIDWNPGRLTAPIYFRPPAVSLPASS
jgi:tRNA threonylcarbamoyladenosine biosynthesis protein TsaB